MSRSDSWTCEDWSTFPYKAAGRIPGKSLLATCPRPRRRRPRALLGRAELERNSSPSRASGQVGVLEHPRCDPCRRSDGRIERARGRGMGGGRSHLLGSVFNARDFIVLLKRPLI